MNIKITYAIGMMSGTSLDGLDLVYVKFAYENRYRFEILSHATVKYSDHWKGQLQCGIQLEQDALYELDLNYGAYLGLALIVISFIVYILGLEEQKSIIPSLLNNFLMIGAVIYSVTIYRDNFNNGFISYGQSLKLGTSVVFFASVILAFYTFIFVTFINPEYLENILKVAEQEILNSDPEISDENLDMALSMTQKMLQPQWMITLSVLGGTFMGFFYSLIISFFVKKEDSNFTI